MRHVGKAAARLASGLRLHTGSSTYCLAVLLTNHAEGGRPPFIPAPKQFLDPPQREPEAPKPHTVMQVWISAELDASGRVRFSGTSDSELSRGLCAVLVTALSGLTPEEVLQVG